MLSTTGKIIFTFVIAATAAGFLIPVIYRLKIILTGQPERRFDHIGKRLGGALSKVILQRCTLKNERIWTGFVHLFIFYGALTFDTMSVNHILEGYVPGFHLFGHSGFGLVFSFIVDLFAALVLAAVTYMVIRRFIIRPEGYNTTPGDSLMIYLLLTVVTLSYLYFEAFAIAAHEGSERWAFLGKTLYGWIGQSGMDSAAITTHFHISWWLHILIVFGFIVYVPHSKYFHMFAGSFNVLVNKKTPMGQLKPLDIEHSEIFGVEKAADMTWKDLLDSFACMECGRCQDACPAYASEKPLSPKMIIFNLRKHLLSEGKKYINQKRDDVPPLMRGTFTEGEIWTCTTCGACMHVCPVEIEHIPKIIGVRQGEVLMESRFPTELNTFFRNMETNSNPWGIGFSERGAWAEGMEVKKIQDHPETDTLLWVGCAGSFDEEGKKITKSVVRLLQKAGVDFAVLGNEEKCCGDSARRLGNEYLFQMQAGENIASFLQYGIKKIISFCPHGYHTFKNEYAGLIPLLPEMNKSAENTFKEIEVIHHSQLFADLIAHGRLQVSHPLDAAVTYHDSCYLGRHNGIMKSPRDLLKHSSAGEIMEMKNHHEHSFCCGAGGGLMWTEENLGSRINHLRTNEVLQTGVKTAATSCPFCQTMLQDGLKDKNREDIQVKDLAQILEDAVKT
jgi:Fe-S oxidoreductase